MFAWGEKLLGQGGKESGLSRLNKEATLTLKYLHPHLTHTVNGTRVKQEYECGCVRASYRIKQQFVRPCRCENVKQMMK